MAKVKIKVKPAESFSVQVTTDGSAGSSWPRLRCIADSRLIVSGERTPSGRRYEFTTGQEQSVNPADYHFLLELQAYSSDCCGSNGKPQNYFEEI